MSRISFVSSPLSAFTNRDAIAAVRTEMKPMATSCHEQDRYYASCGRVWVEVAVPDRGHGADRPPDPVPVAMEVAVVELCLCDARYHHERTVLETHDPKGVA